MNSDSNERLPLLERWHTSRIVTAHLEEHLNYIFAGRYRIRIVELNRLLLGGNGIATLVFDCRYECRSTETIRQVPLFLVPGDLTGRSRSGRAWARDLLTGNPIHLSPEDPDLGIEVSSSDVPNVLGDIEGLRDWKVLGHRPGKRLTLQVESASDGDQEPNLQIVKVYKGKRVERLHRNLTHLERVWGGSRTGLPKILRSDSKRGSIHLCHVPGRSYLERLVSSSASDSFPAGLALASLHRCAPIDAVTHSRSDEFVLIRNLAGRLDRYDSSIGQRIEEALLIVEKEAGGIPEGDPVLAHRDFYDKQIIVSPQGLSILDWDMLTNAPAALDVGNFLAHLRLRALQGRIRESCAERERARFLRGYESGGSCPSSEEIGLFENLSLIRLAGVYSLRPRWSALPEQLLGATRVRLAWGASR